MFYLSSITRMHKNYDHTFTGLGAVLIRISICRAVVGE